jgi:hypothetical protein
MALVRRVAGVLPLVGAVTAAVALTGAAVFTVSQAGCADPGHYEQRDGVVQLVGGCVDRAELPAVDPQQHQAAAPSEGRYRP